MIIVANWKANNVSVTPWLTTPDVGPNIEIVVAAPYTALFLLASSSLTLASQDVSSFPEGAYTGEIPAGLLKELDVKYTLIGHSERRKYFGETTEIVGKKMDKLLANNITPIICAQNFDEIPELAKNTPGEKYLVMFEPFEAISKEGKSNAVDPELVSKTVSEWKEKLPVGVKILYGGSVNSENVSSYADIVSGFVVGHASLDIEEFFKLVDHASLQSN